MFIKANIETHPQCEYSNCDVCFWQLIVVANYKWNSMATTKSMIINHTKSEHDNEGKWIVGILSSGNECLFYTSLFPLRIAEIWVQFHFECPR